MRRRLAPIGTLLVAATVLGSWDTRAGEAGSARKAVPQATTCTPGIRPVKGARLRVFCGPAQARVRFQGKRYAFRNGRCTTTSRGLSIEVGVETLPNPPSTEPPQTSFFGAFIAGTRGGTYHPGSSLLLVWSAPGYAFNFEAGDLHLSAGGTSGTFTGLFYGRGIEAPAFGSFACW